MGYVNVGAYVDGRRPKSKKAVREALADNPLRVHFDVTSGLGSHAGRTFQGDQVPLGVTLSLVGPDPYTDRRFYGSIVKRPDGRVIVK